MSGLSSLCLSTSGIEELPIQTHDSLLRGTEVWDCGFTKKYFSEFKVFDRDNHFCLGQFPFFFLSDQKKFKEGNIIYIFSR